MQAAIDFGLTNIDVVIASHPFDGQIERTALVSSRRRVDETQLRRALDALIKTPRDFDRICVTGGQHRKLPDAIDGVPIVKIGEIDAIGRGGLALADVQEALVVSAGSGTAMIAARQRECHHVTGSAVGGGTLLGLCRLLIGTSDPHTINDLAMKGDANKVDLTLIEATGGAIGKLPHDANAVNFGRVPWLDEAALQDLSKEDVAAGVAVLVGQVIAVIAINAAKAEGLNKIVVVGHLVDLPCMRRVLTTVAGYYGADIHVPAMPGFATALGALLA
jgi:type II pantothenate kinase